MRKFGLLVFLILNFALSPFAGLSQETGAVHNSKPWFNLDRSLFDKEQGLGDLFQQIDKIICNYDSVGNTVCFEFGWRNPCFQLYAFMAPSSGKNFSFSERLLPIFRIDENPDFSLKEFEEYKEQHGFDSLPRVTKPEFAFWLVQYGNYKDFLSQNDGFVVQVLRGEILNISFPLHEDTWGESTLGLIGIEPFLKNSLSIMKRVEPENKVCLD